MHRLLVTGASGYLGQVVARRAATRFDVYAAYNRHAEAIVAGEPVRVDITDGQAVSALITQLQPTAIIHASAVNPGQGDEATMFQVNRAGSRHIAEAAVAVGARLVHVSTDVVHDGNHAPYADDTPPSPLDGYGRSKAAGEAAVLAVCPDAAVVRTSLIYGLDVMDRGTAGFAARLAAGGQLMLFTDVIRQPVWVESLAEALIRLVDVAYSGLLNVAGAQPLTRAEFGQRMLNWWNIPGREHTGFGRAADISDTIPLDLRLDITRAQTLLNLPLPGVDDVLHTHAQ